MGLFKLIAALLLILVHGCEQTDSQDSQSLAGDGTGGLSQELSLLIPESATSSLVVEAGQEARLDDATQKLSFQISGNAFTETVVVWTEPVAESDPSVLETASAFVASQSLPQAYSNPTLAHGFRFTARSLEQEVEPALDIQICHDLAASYVQGAFYVAVITDAAGENTAAPLTLAEGTQTALCLQTLNANAIFQIIALQPVEVVVQDTTPPTEVALSFTVLITDLTSATAQVTLGAVDATKMALASGTSCSTEPTWTDYAESVANFPISLTGEVNQSISLSVLMQDASANISECITATIAFVNTIAQNQQNQSQITPQVQIDTRAPEPPSAIVNPASSFSDSIDVSWTKSNDLDVASYNLKMCPTDQECRLCSASVQEVAASSAPSATITQLAGNTPFYVCLQAVDNAGNLSEWTKSSATTTYLSNNITPFIKRIGAISSSTGSLNLNPDYNEFASLVAYDSKNRFVYIGGVSDGSFAATNRDEGSYTDILVIKADYDGNIVWVKQIQNPEGKSGNEAIEALYLDESGSLIIGGTTTGVLQADASNASEYHQLIFIKLNTEDGAVETLTQLESPTSQFLAGMESDGQGGSYIAIFQNVAAQNRARVRHLASDLKTLGMKSPWVSASTTQADQKSIPIELDSQGNLIVGMTLASGAAIEYCDGEHDEYDETDCGNAGGTWVSGLYVSQGGGDAAILKISTDPETPGKIIDHYQFADNYHNGTTRITSHHDYVYEILVHPQSDVVYMQGATDGDFAEKNGDPSLATADIFVARFSSDLEPTWVKQFGKDTVGSGSSGMELSFGAFARTDQGALVTSFTSTGNFLQESSAGLYNSVIVSLDEKDGAVQWMKQIGKAGRGIVTLSSVGDIFGNIYFCGYLGLGEFIEPGTTANQTGNRFDLFYGVIGQDGTLNIPE